MYLIVGLGNPESQYTYTRHNVGFLAIDYLTTQWNFPKYKLNKKCNAYISKDLLRKNAIICAKPQMFMNNSGISTKALLLYYKIPKEKLIIIHDDSDIEFGNFKISQNGGSAGHNGIKSIITHLGTKNFIRVRIGIRIANETKRQKAEEFVLKNFTTKEQTKLVSIFTETQKNIESVIQTK